MFLALFFLASRLGHPFGFGTFTGIEAQLPFLAFQIIVFFVFVDLLIFRLGGIPRLIRFVITLLIIVVVVRIMPVGIGGMCRVGRENIKGETRTVAVGCGAHPVTLEPAWITDHLLEPHLIARENPAAVQAGALARQFRRGHGIAPGIIRRLWSFALIACRWDFTAHGCDMIPCRRESGKYFAF